MSPTQDLVREIVINARRETVFRFFTDSERWAQWWGAGSTVDPKPGGAVLIVNPGDVRASGVVKEMSPERSFHLRVRRRRQNPGARAPPFVTSPRRPSAPVEPAAHRLPTREAPDTARWRFRCPVSRSRNPYEHGGANERAERWGSLWGEADATSGAQPSPWRPTT